MEYEISDRLRGGNYLGRYDSLNDARKMACQRLPPHGSHEGREIYIFRNGRYIGYVRLIFDGNIHYWRHIYYAEYESTIYGNIFNINPNTGKAEGKR